MFTENRQGKAIVGAAWKVHIFQFCRPSSAILA